MKAVTVLVFTVLVCCLASGEACSTSGDCGHNECCVSAMRPKGKRQLSPGGVGNCHPRPTSGGGCLMRDAVYDSTRMFFQCPCVDGLSCKGNGQLDIPLGEMGTCVRA